MDIIILGKMASLMLAIIYSMIVLLRAVKSQEIPFHLFFKMALGIVGFIQLQYGL